MQNLVRYYHVSIVPWTRPFFYLYGLKINLDSCSEDDLVVHKNTRPGDYQMKEQCADVFQYVLPYAKALSVSKHLMKTLLFVTFDYTL
jgi:hypothetical protein